MRSRCEFALVGDRYMKGYRTYPSFVMYAIAVVVLLAASGCGPDAVDIARQYIDVKMYDKAESLLR